MARYIRKLTTLGSLGPSEERGAGLWIGYDIADVEEDLTHLGLTRVDEWPATELAARGIVSFMVVAEDDEAMRAKLGVGRTR